MELHAGLEEFLREQRDPGLKQAGRLRKAASGDRADLRGVARTFLRFWQRKASLGFRKEEEVLLPVLARYGEDVNREPLDALLDQHARIRGLVMRLSDEITAEEVRAGTLGELGELLEEHVRMKEREAYPAIQRALPDRALEEAVSRLRAFEAGGGAELWVPREGVSYDPWPGPGDSEGGGWR